MSLQKRLMMMRVMGSNMYYADYKDAVKKSVELLADTGIRNAPVVLSQIVDGKKRTVQCYPYEHFMAKKGWTRPQVIAAFGTDDGICFYKHSTEQYLIYYNETMPKKHIRFTIAHELGHVMLDHHARFGVPILKRSSLGDRQYQQLENEASCFARNLLCPAPLASHVLDILGSYNGTLADAFLITNAAADTRCALLSNDYSYLHKLPKSYEESLSRINVQYAPTCDECKTEVPIGSSYCIACGHKVKKKMGFPKLMLPESIPTNKEGRLKYCGQCGNNDISEDAFYCKICGAPLRNYCFNHNTGFGDLHSHLNLPTADYCGTCGSLTLFNVLSIDGGKDDEIMHYHSGVKYDPDTMRVLECPKCGNEDFDEKAEYCKICGTPLYNYCLGEVDIDAFGNGTEDIIRHKNPSNARYCETCGRPTEFYNRKLIQDYEQENMEIENSNEPFSDDDDIPF